MEIYFDNRQGPYASTLIYNLDNLVFFSSSPHLKLALLASRLYCPYAYLYPVNDISIMLACDRTCYYEGPSLFLPRREDIVRITASFLGLEPSPGRGASKRDFDGIRSRNPRPSSHDIVLSEKYSQKS